MRGRSESGTFIFKTEFGVGDNTEEDAEGGWRGWTGQMIRDIDLGDGCRDRVWGQQNLTSLIPVGLGNTGQDDRESDAVVTVLEAGAGSRGQQNIKAALLDNH